MKKILFATAVAMSLMSVTSQAAFNPFAKKAPIAAAVDDDVPAPAKGGVLQRMKQGASSVGSSMRSGMVAAGTGMAKGASKMRSSMRSGMAAGASMAAASVKAGAAKAGTSIAAGAKAAAASAQVGASKMGSSMRSGMVAAGAGIQKAMAPKPWVDAMNAHVATAGATFENNINAADAAHEAAYANAKTALGETFVQAFTGKINKLLADPKVQLADKADYLASLTEVIASLSNNAAVVTHLPGVVSTLEGVRAQAYNQVVAQLSAAASRHTVPTRAPAAAMPAAGEDPLADTGATPDDLSEGDASGEVPVEE